MVDAIPFLDPESRSVITSRTPYLLKNVVLQIAEVSSSLAPIAITATRNPVLGKEDLIHEYRWHENKLYMKVIRRRTSIAEFVPSKSLDEHLSSVFTLSPHFSEAANRSRLSSYVAQYIIVDKYLYGVCEEPRLRVQVLNDNQAMIRMDPRKYYDSNYRLDELHIAYQEANVALGRRHSAQPQIYEEYAVDIQLPSALQTPSRHVL
jgi:hypothetical protein